MRSVRNWDRKNADAVLTDVMVISPTMANHRLRLNGRAV